MELIPLIYLKNHKIYTTSTFSKSIKTTELTNQIKTDTPLYLFDYDGLKNNKPNLCLIQKLSPTNTIWPDCGPRDLGDVVDLFFAGAQKITIRSNLWPDATAPAIREITEQPIYLSIDTPEIITQKNRYNGYILHTLTENPQNNFKFESTIKDLAQHYTLYIHDSTHKNYEYWKKIGTAGILIDLSNYPEYLKHVH